MLMLRNRPRAVTSKQAKMADHSSVKSPNQDHLTTPISPIFGSPRFLRGSIIEGETKPVLSPTSILETKPFPALGNPIWYDNIIVPKSPKKTFPGNKQYPVWEKLDSKAAIGLALINSPDDEKKALDKISTRPSTRTVKLKVQIPPFLPSSAAISPTSSGDFGIKTRNSQLGSVSSVGSPNSCFQTTDCPRISTGYLSVSEMELSEDYTCVISHGPNPKTTHIFDNCIVESCWGVAKSPSLTQNVEHYSFADKSKPASESFLGFCFTCKKNLGLEKDIYIYRGEKAFCSRGCRSQEMLLDGVENPDSECAF